ncbi:MAG: hypothetical protein V3S29_14270 [bacterium]
MFEIDYSLIPLTDQDRVAVDQAVARRLRDGAAPTLNPADSGRLVVLNPDPVQTVHHVPDSLRGHLRRTLVHTTEGHLDLRPGKILAELIGAEGPLHILVVELKSRFAHFGGFLELVSDLRKRFPDIGIFLSADLPTTLAKLQETLAEGGGVLELTYDDARGTVEITDPKELAQVVSNQTAPVSFSVPFFTQIRLNLEGDGKPVVFNLDTLRRLHPRFGYGEQKEVDLGGGRKEKMVVIDLPSRLIRDFQFRQDRGLDFHGIVQGGRKVLSRHFEKEKLEFRWVPFHSVEGFIHKTPGDEEKIAPVAQTQILRVNCFNGHVSFVLRSESDQISLEDVRYIGFRLPAGGGGGAADESGNNGEPAARGEAGGRSMRFDRLVMPGPASDAADPLQIAVREHIFGRTFRNEVERSRKLEIFTRHLNVGAVGPLAAQTLKIFRRYGLEGLIDAESFHYLCDLPKQLPTYFQTPARFEENFRALLGTLKKITAPEPTGSIRLEDFAHNLPVTLEWVDNPELVFDAVKPMEMQVVYNEMQSLISFIGHEFQRNFDIGQEDIAFFDKIGTCRQAGLLAMWMADFKSGAYGPPMPEGAHPDFVFFGTAADKAENDERFFFPSLACSEIFQQTDTRRLFSRIDYEFCVFLEQQISLADHFAREQVLGEVALGDFAPYFDKKNSEARADLDELRNLLATIDATDTPEYLAMLKEEEEAYHERFRSFIGDLDKAGIGHRKSAEAFVERAAEISEQLPPAGEPPPQWFSGEGSNSHAYGLEYLERLRARVAELGQTVGRGVRQVMESFRGRLDALRVSLEAFAAAADAQKEWQRVQSAHVLAGQSRALERRIAERMTLLRRLRESEREGHRRRVRVQLEEIQADGKRLEERVVQHEQQTSQNLSSVRHAVERLLSGFDALVLDAGTETPAQGYARLEKFQARTEKVLKTMHSLVAGMTQTRVQYEQFLARKTRLAGQLHTLRVESALHEATAGKTEPDLPQTATAEDEARLKTRTDERRAAYHEFKRNGEQAAPLLQDTPGELAGLLRGMGPEVEKFQLLAGAKAELEKLAARKIREHQSIAALAERRTLMETELADLPDRVRQKFMPARKELLLRAFIPEAEKKIENFRRAGMLLREIQQFHHDLLKNLYLDRAVYRRFSSNQFLRGAFIAISAQTERGKSLRNVLPAVNFLQRNLHFNVARQHGKKAERVSLSHLKFMEGAELRDFIEQQLNEEERAAYDYVVLPGTIGLAEAVALMNQKGRINHGIPRLVLIYVSKFNAAEILADEELRNAYFNAQKHNVIVNVDGRSVVDNPHTIGLRLLRETLGSTFDTDQVEDMEEEEKDAAFKV